jgi:hypothetical protein
MNAALRSAYADCVSFHSQDYVVLHGQACVGRTDRVVQE